MTPASALQRYRLVMGFFIAGLGLSGVTAFPLLAELKMLSTMLGVGDATSAAGHSGLPFWILTVRFGLEHTYQQYPWIGYGTDWLAFGHLVIAMFFVGAWLRPAESRYTLNIGLIACAAIFPLALICGPIRGIPFYWQLIDCSFGLFGSLPLLYCRSLLRFMLPSAPANALNLP